MQVYKFKCDNCGSTSCDKIDDTTYKCIFCGREQRIFMEQPKVSDEDYMSSNSETKEEPKASDENKDSKNETKNDNFAENCKDLYKNNKSLVLLLVCIFVGYMGVHKFLQGKIVMGIIYFLTGGLFSIGWIIDIITCALDCVKDFNKK